MHERDERRARRRGSADPSDGSELEHEARPLEEPQRRAWESRLGHDLGEVRIHEGAGAAESARRIDALAYAAGNDIVMGDAFSHGSPERTRLLAHELAHVVQQRAAQGTQGVPPVVSDSPAAEAEAERVADGQGVDPGHAPHAIARAPTSLGTKFTHPTGSTSAFKNVHAEFDGSDFTVFDGSTSILTHPAQSGRPVSVRPADAAACKGSTADSYLNNPRYVGIKDFGPIPEGEYVFSLGTFATFTGAEQLTMISGGMFVDPFGTALHGGDWGSGRAPLRPTRIVPAPKGCGSTTTRSGFYLHGGSLPGSSGCIDVDNDGIDGLLKLLTGYRKDIPVKVAYSKAAPSVGWGTRRLGGFTYPTDEHGRPIKDPTIWDRVKGATKD